MTNINRLPGSDVRSFPPAGVLPPEISADYPPMRRTSGNTNYYRTEEQFTNSPGYLAGGGVVAGPPPGPAGAYSGRALPVASARRPHRSHDDSSSTSSDGMFERDVTTLNRCFDEIERFVARIQQAGAAQRELESRKHLNRKRHGDGILAVRAQMPSEAQFVDILKKFKLCFILLAKLRNHIHDPNAPELLHFLFTPLTLILDACRWSLGENIAPRILAPLITREAKELMSNCLTSKETDVWLALGDSWRVPEDEWPRPLPPPYYPVFYDGYMPYGPASNTSSPANYSGGPSPPKHVENLGVDVSRLQLEEDRINFEKTKLLDRERRLADAERRIMEERKQLQDEQKRFFDDQEKYSERSFPTPGIPATHATAISNGVGPYREATRSRDSSQPSPSGRRLIAEQNGIREQSSPLIAPGGSEEIPRGRAFIEDLRNRRARAVQVLHDRVGSNAKELTVSKGEILEVTNDSKQWWECRNILNRYGFVPHTILQPINPTSFTQDAAFIDSSPSGGVPTGTSGQQLASSSAYYNREARTSGGAISPHPAVVIGPDTPDFIRDRMGKRGEFRYF